jgi:hypothetical protein
LDKYQKALRNNKIHKQYLQKYNQYYLYLKSLKNDEVLDTNKVILNIVSMLDKDVGDFIENMNSLLKTDNI